jgi:hypothetical protein
LRTMVQPQTRAAASFQTAIMMEKFHGTMPTTGGAGESGGYSGRGD